MKLSFITAALLALGLRSSSAPNILDIMSDETPQGATLGLVCNTRHINEVNRVLRPKLDQLVKTEFFRYAKLNLDSTCTYWKADFKCSSPHCAVSTLDDPPNIYKNRDLGEVSFPSFDLGSRQIALCDTSKKDFFIFDDASGALSGNTDAGKVIVDLVKNPERYTGYEGEDSWKVWRMIYEENCFTSSNGDGSSLENATEDANGRCLEEEVYYRIASGLHASVNMHVCLNYLFKSTDTWGPNFQCFVSRFEDHPERIHNVYFTYALLLRAMTKAKDVLLSTQFCEDPRRYQDIKSQLEDVLTTGQSCEGSFDETLLFATAEAKRLKEPFRQRFRNLALIMDCVSCEKCRLWGKVQVAGLATALKILFSYTESELESAKEMSGLGFKPFEVTALINTFHRFSESVTAIQTFVEQYRDFVADRSHKVAPEPAKSQARSREAIMSTGDGDDTRARGHWAFEFKSGQSTLPLVIIATGAIVMATGLAVLMRNGGRGENKRNRTASLDHTAKTR